jgi:glycosyltransferase involved in cell wall biosynthesis
MKVSVLMLAYNHQKFIARAVESALDQETTFPYEIVIRDDNSTDDTPKILAQYQANYPALLRVLPTDRRLGMHQNLRETYRACRGEYLAALDGDDFWTCPQKLQRQADFLDAHPQCSACFHNALVIDEDGNYFDKPFCWAEQKEFATVEDMLARNFIPTSAALYRFRRFPKGFLTELRGVLVADWPVNVAYALQGPIGYLKEVMSVYTKHAAGLWTGASSADKVRSLEDMYTAIDRYTNQQYAPLIQALITRWRDHFALDEMRREHRRQLECLRSERDQMVADLQQQLQVLRMEIANLRRQSQGTP